METQSYISRADSRLLLAEMDRIATERDTALRMLASARLQSANRLAAIRAALGAADDGEADPLAYLNDQLADEAGSGL
jgi:hypothetical protein